MSEDLDAARAAFAKWVRTHHQLDADELVPRPELDGGGFHGFTAVSDGRFVRGLARPDLVLTSAVDDAFARWVAAVDFAHTAGSDADAVRLVHVHQALLPPPRDRYAESSFPLVTEAQIATAPLGDVAEAVTPPALDVVDGGRRVGVWFQAEPGSRFEHWEFNVAADNGLTIERRPADAKL